VFDQQVENALYRSSWRDTGARCRSTLAVASPTLGRYRSVPEVWGADATGDSSLPRATGRYPGDLEIVYSMTVG